jgi:hypothetical protein
MDMYSIVPTKQQKIYIDSKELALTINKHEYKSYMYTRIPTIKNFSASVPAVSKNFPLAANKRKIHCKIIVLG